MPKAAGFKRYGQGGLIQVTAVAYRTQETRGTIRSMGQYGNGTIGALAGLTIGDLNDI